MGIEIFRSADREMGAWESLNAGFGMRMPVLLYHHIGVHPLEFYPSLSITPQTFERQIRWLARNGYIGIRPSDWLAGICSGKILPRKPLLLTFDDAYSGLAEYALPVLRRYNYGAVVFVVTDRVGQTNTWDIARGAQPYPLMTREQIREWATYGIEFGAHTCTHPDLTKLTGAALESEIADSRQDLADILGTLVTTFAYPYGHYNAAAQDVVRREFKLAFTCEEGMNDLRTDPLLLRRTMVVPSDSLVDLRFRVKWGWSPIQRIRSRLRIRSRIGRFARFLHGANE